MLTKSAAAVAVQRFMNLTTNVAGKTKNAASPEAAMLTKATRPIQMNTRFFSANRLTLMATLSAGNS